MSRILVLLFLATAPLCKAEVSVGNALTITRDEIPFGDFSLDVIRGDRFFFQDPNLELIDFSIGSETLIFAADFGDVLSSDTVSSFPVIAPSPGLNMEVPIPFGESYVGFAVREPVENEPFHTIGWAKLLRTNDTLHVLENAAEFEPGAFSASMGIVVGVPEPSGPLPAIFAAMACFGFARRRTSVN